MSAVTVVQQIVFTLLINLTIGLILLIYRTIFSLNIYKSKYKQWVGVCFFIKQTSQTY